MSVKGAPRRPSKPLNLRIPPELKEQLERDASRSLRSINAEVVMRLENSYAKDAGRPAAQQQ